MNALQQIINDLNVRSMPVPWRRKALLDAMHGAHAIGLLDQPPIAHRETQVILVIDGRTLSLDVSKWH